MFICERLTLNWSPEGRLSGKGDIQPGHVTVDKSDHIWHYRWGGCQVHGHFLDIGILSGRSSEPGNPSECLPSALVHFQNQDDQSNFDGELTTHNFPAPVSTKLQVVHTNLKVGCILQLLRKCSLQTDRLQSVSNLLTLSLARVISFALKMAVKRSSETLVYNKHMTP
jgi:hypothetical protein